MTTKPKKLYGTRDLERRLGERTVAEFMRSWRLVHEVTQAEFARKLGISRANLCDIEMGRKGISPQRAADIAKRIGYSENVLIEMAIEEQLAAAGLKFSVVVKPAA